MPKTPNILSLLVLCLLLSTIATQSSAQPVVEAGIEIRQVWIPMPDGVRLSADLYLPADGQAKNLPVLLEYLPYRKDDSRARNFSLYSYFLRHGYLVARVDIRGTGNSEGRTIPYEYSDIELDDGEQVIAWLSNQPWSSGKVGMFGISWGGFNSIQMALRNPPALKAFIAICATEDLYQEDVHYIDGIMHTDSWMMSNDLYNSLPGAPDFVMDEDWYKNRFDVEPSVYTYMREQRDGPFWERASALGKYDQIKIPGFHIGGWYDGYRDSLPRMLENVKAPVKAMIGPWDHDFPHNASHSPQMEWRHEAVRWFDHWLKGIDTGIMDEPAFAVYVRDWHPPGPGIYEFPGRWRWEDGWPIERTRNETWFAQGQGSLAKTTAEATVEKQKYVPSSGLEAGGPVMWWGSVLPDLQPSDDNALVYDSEPLERPLEILGAPVAHLRVSADATRANWIARIADVAPDGRVTHVAAAAFNGSHRESARTPADIVAGEEFPLNIEMHFTSWVFAPGHRIRFSVANSQWPMLWPTPYPMTTTLALGGEEGARVELPVIPQLATNEWRSPVFKEPAEDPDLPGFATLDSGNSTGYGEIEAVKHDAKTGEAFGIASNSGAYRYPWGVERFEERIEHRTSDSNPANTSVKGIYALQEELPDRLLRFEQEVMFRSDLENFYLTFKRRVLVNGVMKHQKEWKETIPRDFQ
jgi:putative CocE/NonD family hydrolase